jgi:tetratricopeptide (TPR) repeat protein
MLPIRGQIVKALAVQLTPGEQERVARKGTENITAYDAFLKGWRHFLRVTPADLLEAARYFKEAIELDPNYGKAYAALARTYMEGHLHGFDKKMGLQFIGGLVARANNYLRKAMKNPTFIAHQVAAEIYFKRHEYEAAIAEAERAIALDPNDPTGQRIMGMILTWSGRPNEALGFFKTAMRLDPLNPARYLLGLGEAHFCMGQLEKAATYFERALKHNPELYSMAVLATYAYLGRAQEVRALVENYKKGLLKDAYFNLRGQMATLPIKDPIVAERLANGLLKAGMPGEPGGYYRINKENKMRGEEIRELFFGRAHAGFFIGTNWTQIIDIKEDGNATYRIGTLSDRGNAWIEEDMLCLQWEKMLDGYGICGYFYRNPNGNPETQDEFLYVSELYIGPRSLFE